MRLIFLLSACAELALAGGLCNVDPYDVHSHSMRLHGLVCGPEMLDVSADVDRKAIDEDVHEFIIVEDVTSP